MKEKVFTKDDLLRIKEIALSKQIHPVGGYYFVWGGRFLNESEAEKYYLDLIIDKKHKEAEDFLRTLKSAKIKEFN